MDPGVSRRALLSGVFGAGAGLALARARLAHADDAGAGSLVGPRSLIVRSMRPENLETPPGFLGAEFTPNDVFFVRSHFGPPIVAPRAFRLDLSGLCDRP
jgi:hypothetical protein